MHLTACGHLSGCSADVVKRQKMKGDLKVTSTLLLAGGSVLAAAVQTALNESQNSKN